MTSLPGFGADPTPEDSPAVGPTGLRTRIPRRQIAEIIVAVLVLFERLWDVPLGRWWRDWLVLICLYWIFLVLCGNAPARRRVTLAAACGLAAIYAWGALPHLLAALRPSG